MSELNSDAHKDSNRQLLETGAYSDLILCCGERKFHVHRAILCTKSIFFAKACEGNFMEATSGTINLVGDDLDTVVRMLSYLYTSEYDDVKSHILGLENPIPLLSNPNNSSSKTTRPTSGDEDGPPQKIARIEKYTSPIDDDVRSALFNNVLVYAIADKYDIVGLQAVAIEYFKSRAKELKRWPPPYLREIVKMVYETTPESDRGLRRALVKICYTYHTPSTLNLEDAYKATATEFNAFCWDLLRYVHSYYTGSRMRQSGFIL